MSEETPSQHISTSLFTRIKDFTTNFWDGFFSFNPATTNPLFDYIAKILADTFDKKLSDKLVDSVNNLINDLDLPDEIKETITKVLNKRDTGSIILSYLLLFVYQIQMISGHAAVAGELAGHKWRSDYTPSLADIGTLITNLFRNPELTSSINEILNKYGFNDDQINLLINGAKTILNPDQIRLLYLRDLIPVETHDLLLKNFGYSDDLIVRIKELYHPIPSYPDLINMAVREAFQPDYISQYDLMAEYPGDFEAWAMKQGLSEDWCKKYWVSHWSLPSILQGYEMLHRNVIDANNLDSLFMAQDIMPWWRDKLKAISYNPLTRVDVRRVFNMGIISQEQVKRTYLDLGYDDEKATWLTNFTVMNSVEKERDLTKTEILSAYEKRIINIEDTQTLLTDLGYSQAELNIIISTKDYAIFKKTKDLTIQRVKKMYLAGIYDHTEAVSELGQLDLPGTEQTALVSEWDSERLAKLRNLTKKEYDSLFSAEIISESEYKNELSILGYKTKHINWSLQLLKSKGTEG